MPDIETIKKEWKNVKRINGMTIMIKVTDLSKIFRTEEIETTALNGVSFEIKEGEFVDL